MGKQHIIAKRSCSLTKSAFIGILCAILVSALLTAGLAGLTINGNLNETMSKAGVFLTRAVSVLLGALLGTGLGKSKYLQIIGIVVLGYLLLLIGIGIIMFDGSFQKFVLGVISVMTGGAAACLIRLKPQKTRRHAVRHSR